MRSLGRLAGLTVDFGYDEDAEGDILSRPVSTEQQPSYLGGPVYDAPDEQEQVGYGTSAGVSVKLWHCCSQTRLSS